jgi:pyridoxamine 5'-phosphate oxidase family protein
MFSENEAAYIKSQVLARFASVDAGGQPDVVPVGFEFDGHHIYVGGRDMETTRKYKNAQVHAKMAIVIDDMISTDPWRPRGIKIYGSGRLVKREGRRGLAPYIELTPEKHWSWGIEQPAIVDGKTTFNRADWKTAPA